MSKSSATKVPSPAMNPYSSPSDKEKRSPTKLSQSPIKLPQSNVSKRNILQVTNAFCPDGTPYGWIYGNAYDIKEQLKALSNKIGEITYIGGIEFKSFSNLTVKWIKESQVENLLWVMRIDGVDTAGTNDNSFPMSAHKAYSNTVLRSIIAKRIKTIGEIEINPDLTLTDSNMENMNDMFGKMTGGGHNIRDALLEEFIAETGEYLEQLI
jgi:hypothetical protein